MTQVDFLPESYHHARKLRGRLMRQIVLVACVAGCLVAATIGIKAHSLNQARTAERLEDTADSERTALNLISGLDHERQALLKSFELKRELEPPVTYAQVLASLGHVLPEGIAVTELSMMSVRPEPEPLRDAKSAGRKQPQATAEAPREPNLIGVEIRGLAPDDLAVALLVSALDEHLLFERVTMRSSEGVEEDGLLAREFNLTATVDVDREFRWVNDVTEEVAHAE